MTNTEYILQEFRYMQSKGYDKFECIVRLAEMFNTTESEVAVILFRL